MRRALAVLVVLAAASALAQDSASGACARWMSPALSDGPIALGFVDADVATGRRTCPRTEAALGARIDAVIDTPDFYGNILATGMLSGSYALSDKRELFATLELLRYQYVVNAVINTTQLAVGQTTVGASQVTFLGDAVGGAVSARLMLPTSFATGNTRVFGAEVGHSVTWRPSSNLELHGWAGADFSAGLSAAPAFPRFGGLLNAGVQYSPVGWFGAALDLDGRVGPLSYLAPAVALRFGLGRSVGAELAATLPVLGTDRHDAIVGLRLSYRP